MLDIELPAMKEVSKVGSEVPAEAIERGFRGPLGLKHMELASVQLGLQESAGFIVATGS